MKLASIFFTAATRNKSATLSDAATGAFTLYEFFSVNNPKKEGQFFKNY